jgi:hypothetical protein
MRMPFQNIDFRKRYVPNLNSMLIALLICSSAFIVGCGEKETVTNAPVDVEVLATVNGEPITRADVEFSLKRTFSQLDLMSVDADLQNKVLESLVASRAMKQLAREELTPTELTRIENATKAYEEELYIKEYLQRHAVPEPVTTEMVEKYYRENAREFGAETLRDFELLKAPANLQDSQRDQLLSEVENIRAATNWSSAAKSWGEKWGLQYQQARSKAGLLDKTLEQRLSVLSKNETSEVFYIDGSLHLVRVTNLTQTPPKALAEVSGEIRKRLAPLMLREAVKKVSEEARAKVEVIMTTSNQ